MARRLDVTAQRMHTTRNFIPFLAYNKSNKFTSAAYNSKSTETPGVHRHIEDLPVSLFFHTDARPVRHIQNVCVRSLLGARRHGRSQFAVLLGVRSLQLCLLGEDAFLAALARLAHLQTAGLGLVAQHLGALIVGLLLVDELHQDALVLEHVTLALHVQLMVQVSVDLLVVAVLLQQATQHTLPLHPQVFDGHTGICCTLALTETTVATLAACLGVLAHAITRVHDDGLLDDQTVLDQLADVLACNERTSV